MRRIGRLIRALMCLFIGCYPLGATSVQIPAECADATGTIAVIDCLKNQGDIQRHLLEYLELKIRISEIQANLQDKFIPQVTENSIDSDSSTHLDPLVERTNWFDQQLEVYAIAGTPASLTAYARLDGREYRLQQGDSIRLATVVEVQPRQIVLSIFDRQIIVGLASRKASTQ